MFRAFLFAFLIAFATSSFAQKTTDVARGNDTHWDRVDDHSWVIDIAGAGRQETIVLKTVGKRAFITVSRPCLNSPHTEVWWWERGHKFAKGTTCAGEGARMSVKHWEGWINPLPPEARGRMM